jgi:hypothetical protein
MLSITPADLELKESPTEAAPGFKPEFSHSSGHLTIETSLPVSISPRRQSFGEASSAILSIFSRKSPREPIRRGFHPRKQILIFLR